MELLSRTTRQPRHCGGFTMIEVLVTTAVMMIIIAGAFTALATFNRNVERVTDQTAAIFALEGELERVRTIQYLPPVSPFASTNISWVSNVTLSLDYDGSSFRQIAAMRTTVQPAAHGHLVTVSLTYSNAFRPTNLWMQTVVNKFSAGQP